MDSNIFEVATLTIAWLLGLLAPTIIRRIERKYQASDVGAGIIAEAGHLRYTLALVAFRLRSRLKTFDQPFITWITGVMDSESGEEEDGPTWREAAKKLLALPVAQLNSAAAAQLVPGQVTRPIPYSLPYLESQLGQLHLFPPDLQRRLMSIRYYLTLFNSDVDFARQMFDLTFDPAVMAVNQLVIDKNIESSYKKLAGRAERLAKEIGELIELGVS